MKTERHTIDVTCDGCGRGMSAYDAGCSDDFDLCTFCIRELSKLDPKLRTIALRERVAQLIDKAKLP